MAPVSKQLVYQRGVAASDPSVAGVDANTQATMATEMEDQEDRHTVNYGSDIEVDDADMPSRVEKRKEAVVEHKDKKKPKVSRDIEADVKREGVKPVKKDNKILKKKNDDDEPQMTGVSLNRSTDTAFWEQQSARELRTQLNLRQPGKVGDWAFKTRLQLINIVKDMIIRGTW